MEKITTRTQAIEYARGSDKPPRAIVVMGRHGAKRARTVERSEKVRYLSRRLRPLRPLQPLASSFLIKGRSHSLLLSRAAILLILLPALRSQSLVEIVDSSVIGLQFSP